MKLLNDHWQMLIALVLVVSLFTTVQVNQQVYASRLDKLELIRDDITEIKIRVEKIYTRLEEQDKQKGK
jgi:low affinity Fe/Cu permease